jgi:hypothetical protein
MKHGDSGSPPDEALKPCLHNRLLERIAGNEPDKYVTMMRCCECGKLISRPSHDSRS